MEPKIDHLQFTVKDFTKAEEFYDQLMPILGFDLTMKSKGRVDKHDFDVVEYVHENLTIGINSPRKEFESENVHRRKPGSVHHLAFKANSKEEVDTLYQAVLKTKANIVAPPQLYPQHGEYYYALFFKDLDGIKLEIVYEKRD
ncbi:MAG: VOC family protein [Schleiferiaceae bacterium]|jgi:catechol 2,3-dioxygenase-like lactoylglutathione lyase family enzyme|nr:VOC family protein [Schleiferiaceae bacterium]